MRSTWFALVATASVADAYVQLVVKTPPGQDPVPADGWTLSAHWSASGSGQRMIIDKKTEKKADWGIREFNVMREARANFVSEFEFWTATWAPINLPGSARVEECKGLDCIKSPKKDEKKELQDWNDPYIGWTLVNMKRYQATRERHPEMNTASKQFLEKQLFLGYDKKLEDTDRRSLFGLFKPKSYKPIIRGTGLFGPRPKNAGIWKLLTFNNPNSMLQGAENDPFDTNGEDLHDMGWANIPALNKNGQFYMCFGNRKQKSRTASDSATGNKETAPLNWHTDDRVPTFIYDPSEANNNKKLATEHDHCAFVHLKARVVIPNGNDVDYATIRRAENIRYDKYRNLVDNRREDPWKPMTDDEKHQRAREALKLEMERRKQAKLAKAQRESSQKETLRKIIEVSGTRTDLRTGSINLD